MCGGALYDGTWVFSDLLKLNVTSYGQLDKPVLQLKEGYGAGEISRSAEAPWSIARVMASGSTMSRVKLCVPIMV